VLRPAVSKANISKQHGNVHIVQGTTPQYSCSVLAEQGCWDLPGVSEMEALSTPLSEERCRMKFENAFKMPAWEMLTPECHHGDLGGKPNLSFQCWKLLLLGGVMTETELAGSCSLPWVSAV